jgi:hypothetical protein
MPETHTVDLPFHATAELQASVRLPETFTAATGQRPPLFVPRDQLYYWTREWQSGEAEALRELAEGDFFTFHDGTSAAEWLLDDTDADED